VKYLLILFLLLGCGKDEEITVPCVASKELASVWTHRANGLIIDYRTCGVDVTCQIIVSGTCDDEAGEFTAHFSSNGNVALANCADTVLADVGKWNIGCDNVLTLSEWQTGDPNDVFD